ncbi:hypothetical protein [Sphingomonas sp. R1]|uniref:hypothetical protein n=1 Tax=Sphingomonas sp. R1 TaxID=399176 RepID=UPI002225AD81|nr:hypothetical protein [Sphingomonas sp. R1]UYY79108.1 hypothetical protein OIM94_09055 [Sphingomonas sp. R1]
MADKKAKKAKKNGETSSLLPKVIGGIKLPKDARRQLTALAKHPVVADLIAAGLVALANRIKGDEPKSAPSPTPEPTPEPTQASAEAAAPAAAEPAAPSAVKRIRKRAAEPAAPSEAPAEAPSAAKPAKAPPPRRTRKTADTVAKPRTRRTPPKTDG